VHAQATERCGLVSGVVPLAELMNEAMKAAGKICELSLPVVVMAKESVKRAFHSGGRRAFRAPPFLLRVASPLKTRSKAWRPSSKSASRLSGIANAAN